MKPPGNLASAGDISGHERELCAEGHRCCALWVMIPTKHYHHHHHLGCNQEQILEPSSLITPQSSPLLAAFLSSVLLSWTNSSHSPFLRIVASDVITSLVNAIRASLFALAQGKEALSRLSSSSFLESSSTNSQRQASRVNR